MSAKSFPERLYQLTELVNVLPRGQRRNNDRESTRDAIGRGGVGTNQLLKTI